MSANSTEEGKRLLRADAISLRKRLSIEDSEIWSRSIQESVVRFPPYLCASKVVLYNPLRGEVDTRLIGENALSARKMVFYPNPEPIDRPELILVERNASAAEIRFDDRDADSVVFSTGSTLIILPGLLFDSSGNRLGRGGGWYDRLLGGPGLNAVPLALAYEFQIVNEVPVQQWDRPVDYIVTERRIIDCARERSNLAS